MKKTAGSILAMVLAAAIAISFVGCGKEKTEVPPAEAGALDARAQQIETTYKTDTGLNQVIFTTKNGSSANFTGKIFFAITSGTTTVNGGYLEIIDLPAGQSSVSRIDVNTTENLIISVEVSEGEFGSAFVAEPGSLDSKASSELSDAFSEDFGYKEFATSWHKYVDSIEVFDGGQRSVVIVVNGGSPDDINRIGSAVFANYKKEFDFSLVIVKDAAGTEIWRKDA